MPQRSPLLTISALILVAAVTGCAPGALQGTSSAAPTPGTTEVAASAPPSPSSRTPEPDAATAPSSATPSESAGAAQSASFDGWVTLTLPAGWRIVPDRRPDTGEGNSQGLVIDEAGQAMVGLYLERRDFVYDVPACTPSQIPFQLTDEQPLPDALPGEQLARTVSIFRFDDFELQPGMPETVHELRVGLHEQDRVTGPECAPPSAVYPDTGGHLWVSASPDALRFTSAGEAEQHAQTEQFQELVAVIDSARITL